MYNNGRKFVPNNYGHLYMLASGLFHHANTNMLTGKEKDYWEDFIVHLISSASVSYIVEKWKSEAINVSLGS